MPHQSSFSNEGFISPAARSATQRPLTSVLHPLWVMASTEESWPCSRSRSVPSLRILHLVTDHFRDIKNQSPHVNMAQLKFPFGPSDVSLEKTFLYSTSPSVLLLFLSYLPFSTLPVLPPFCPPLPFFSSFSPFPFLLQVLNPRDSQATPCMLICLLGKPTTYCQVIWSSLNSSQKKWMLPDLWLFVHFIFFCNQTLILLMYIKDQREWEKKKNQK